MVRMSNVSFDFICKGNTFPLEKQKLCYLFCFSPAYSYLRTIFGIGTQELLVIALIVLLLFGGKKIPELMKGLGKGVKSFKEGVNGLDEIDDEAKKKKDEEKQE